ncbi:MAG: PqqD family protein [Deltaproteobacteria bacterium]|nr:PqqD family protein [Deltaproteobacteria bacterium]MBW2020382.1 PqqD family protein [Deltaproteobacteria bacterium]MBW2074688.1 PqqD family protein [Deltaproteobacteria bacterium]
MMKENRVFKQAAGFSFIEVDNGCILYRDADMMAHSLNQTASFVWALCDGRHTVHEIADALKTAFDVKGVDVLKVVEDIVEAFLRKHLIEQG